MVRDKEVPNEIRGTYTTFKEDIPARILGIGPFSRLSLRRLQNQTETYSICSLSSVEIKSKQKKGRVGRRGGLQMRLNNQFIKAKSTDYEIKQTNSYEHRKDHTITKE